MWSSRATAKRPDPVYTSRPDPELDDLNGALCTLAAAFPNVRPEVFREMLTTLSKESRAQVVAEHLLRDDAKWVRGRWRFPAQETNSRIIREVYELDPDSGTVPGIANRLRHRDAGRDDEELMPLEEAFRTESYKNAVYAALRPEFKSLSRSTIQGVLAEQNFSYTLARPILVSLSAKTWRASLNSLFTRFKGGSLAKVAVEEDHYMLQWTPSTGLNRGIKTPVLRATGDDELDNELQITVLGPLIDRRKAKEEAISLELALLLNEQEAEQASATFECQVCYADVTFEQMAMCTSSAEGHVICFGCVQRAMSEALYGQSWDLTIDHERGQMACIASSAEPCTGCIPRALAERAILSGKSGSKVWKQFERRISQEALHASGTLLVQCPFCPYTEVDSLYLPSEPVWMLNTRHFLTTFFLVLLGLGLTVLFLAVFLVPFLIFSLLGLPLLGFKHHLVFSRYVQAAVSDALETHLRRSELPQRFVCKNPECRRASCLECRKAWRDVHKCHESAALSLRTTVEAARTAALKRTCPRCGLGFVKDSGCNKMVCVCGYAMCYICRQGLGEKKGGLLMLGDADNQGHGYAHFCQHFRPMGGQCSECDRCDLYKAEDEDEIVKRAGERAENEWKERNGMGDEMHVLIGGDDATVDMILDAWKRFTLQSVITWWISNVLVCKLDSEVVQGHEFTRA